MSELEKLVLLQEIDNEILRLKNRKEEIPFLIQDIQKTVEENKLNLESQKKELNDSKIQNKDLENDLKKTEAEIEKHNTELNSIKSNEAYNALLKEIDLARGKKEELETKILENLEIMNNATDEFNKKIEANKEEELKLNKKLEDLQLEDKDIDKKIEHLNNERVEKSKDISKEYLDKYNRILERTKNNVISKVIDNCCSECNMQLLLETKEELLQKKGLVFCNNCGRILHLKEEI